MHRVVKFATGLLGVGPLGVGPLAGVLLLDGGLSHVPEEGTGPVRRRRHAHVLEVRHGAHGRVVHLMMEVMPCVVRGSAVERGVRPGQASQTHLLMGGSLVVRPVVE